MHPNGTSAPQSPSPGSPSCPVDGAPSIASQDVSKTNIMRGEQGVGQLEYAQPVLSRPGTGHASNALCCGPAALPVRRSSAPGSPCQMPRRRACRKALTLVTGRRARSRIVHKHCMCKVAIVLASRLARSSHQQQRQQGWVQLACLVPFTGPCPRPSL